MSMLLYFPGSWSGRRPTDQPRWYNQEYKMNFKMQFDKGVIHNEKSFYSLNTKHLIWTLNIVGCICTLNNRSSLYLISWVSSVYLQISIKLAFMYYNTWYGMLMIYTLFKCQHLGFSYCRGWNIYIFSFILCLIISWDFNIMYMISRSVLAKNMLLCTTY